MALSDRFDAIHYAADLGHAKPAPEFYAAIEARTGYAPTDIFFIDDKAANVEAARARDGTPRSGPARTAWRT